MRPTIVAHRGLWVGKTAENSRAAFQVAADFGFQSECDVWLTADGEPVVMHDETVDRTTDGHGLVASMSADRVKKLTLRIANEPPPLLGEVADLVHLVEIKPANAAKLVERVIEIMGPRRWMLQSFDPGNLRHALKINADLPVALLAEDERGVVLGITNDWRLHLNHELLDDRIGDMLREGGVPFGVWTVNDGAQLRRVLPWNPETFISDEPLNMRRLLTSE